MTFGSLFAGIGGMDLGLERAGMQCKWQVEIDDYATKVLEKHWPNVERFRDVRECGKHNLRAVDVIAGGFPCQDISFAGAGAGLDGERSGLYFEVLRLVRQLKPKYIFLENVSALLNRGLDRVLGTLAEVGYDAEWHCLQAADFGAPHLRDRIFIVGYANGERRCGGIARFKYAEDAWKPPISSAGRRWEFKEWCTEPSVGRVVDGISNRVDRLRGLGNAVVPQIAEWIGQRIMEAAG